jgi:hypothetical protein
MSSALRRLTSEIFRPIENTDEIDVFVHSANPISFSRQQKNRHVFARKKHTANDAVSVLPRSKIFSTEAPTEALRGGHRIKNERIECEVIRILSAHATIAGRAAEHFSCTRMKVFATRSVRAPRVKPRAWS